MKSFIKYLLLALAFTPLVVDASVFFPYITGKSIFIRVIITLVSLLCAGYILYSTSFRVALAKKIKEVSKNPLVLSTVAFMGVVLLSTLFAVNKFRAFFGDVERGEGLVGMIFFFGFFVFTLLLFERKDWLWFFRLSLITGGVLFINQAIQYLGHVDRPSSYTGNPIYIAAYFLFVIMSATMVLVWAYFEKKEKGVISQSGLWWTVLGAIMIPLSLMGIFMSETRGVLLGVGVGVCAVLVYAAWRGKDVVVSGSLNLQKIGVGLLVLMVIGGGIFLITRHASLWQKIPGVDRIANISNTDISTQTRLISMGVSLRAITPSNVGWGKFLIGWGPENFSIAYNQFYNPRYFEFEQQWFDRAHNKLLDVLVMNGVLGFCAYAVLWLSFGWLIFRKKEFSIEKATLLFFGAAYFTQNVTVFDSITTYIPFFGALAFCIFLFYESYDEKKTSHKTSLSTTGAWIMAILCFVGATYHLLHGSKIPGEFISVYAPFIVFGIFALVMSFSSKNEYHSDHKTLNESALSRNILLGTTIGVSLLAIFYLVLVSYSLVGYSQMKEYISLIQSGDATELVSHIDETLYPYTFVQENIRPNFLQGIAQYAGQGKQMASLLDKAVGSMEELVTREQWNPRHMLVLGQFYDQVAIGAGQTQFLKIAEQRFRAALKLGPQRQDIRDVLAYNLSLQGRIDESFALLDETIALDPKVIDPHYYYAIIVLSQERKGLYTKALDHLEVITSLPSYNKQDTRVISAYQTLLRYFFEQHDAKNFIVTASRLASLDTENKSEFLGAILSAQKENWGAITLSALGIN